MSSPQIRTLELLIVEELNIRKEKDDPFWKDFKKMIDHFTDEEYLHGVEHTAIIKKIYYDNFYKYKTVQALAQEMHIDPKPLLGFRKNYLQLFAKYYFKFNLPTNTDFFLLYINLKKDLETYKMKKIAAP